MRKRLVRVKNGYFDSFFFLNKENKENKEGDKTREAHGPSTISYRGLCYVVTLL